MKVHRFTKDELDVYGIIEIDGDSEMQKYIVETLDKHGFIRGKKISTAQHPVDGSFIFTQED